jgi:hypothetical protein
MRPPGSEVAEDRSCVANSWHPSSARLVPGAQSAGARPRGTDGPASRLTWIRGVGPGGQRTKRVTRSGWQRVACQWQPPSRTCQRRRNSPVLLLCVWRLRPTTTPHRAGGTATVARRLPPSGGPHMIGHPGDSNCEGADAPSRVWTSLPRAGCPTRRHVGCLFRKNCPGGAVTSATAGARECCQRW